MRRDSMDQVKIRKLHISGKDRKNRSAFIPLGMLRYWQIDQADPAARMMAMRMIVKDGYVACAPLKDKKTPSGDLYEFIVKVSPAGPMGKYGRFAFPRPVITYFESLRPGFENIRIKTREGWFVCEPV